MHHLRSVTLSGTPTQIGLRHGEMLAVEIRFLVAQLHRLVFCRAGRIRGIGLRTLVVALARAMDRWIPPHLRDEMAAVATAARLRYADILLLNTLDDSLNILRRLAPHVRGSACSAFALFGSRSGDGGLLHGRNLDYHFRGTPLDDGGEVARLLHRKSLLFAIHPEGRSPFLSVAWPGIVGVTTGLSRDGLSISNLTSYLRGTSAFGVPTSLLYRSVLEEAATLQEASALLGSAARTIGNNVLVGSGRENSARLFEITRDSVVEMAPQDGMVVASNHFVSEKLALRQLPYLLPHSIARWARLLELCDRRGASVEDAERILADSYAGGDGSGNAFWRVANEGTAVSVVMRPAAMELRVAVAESPPASQGHFVSIDAGALLRPAAT